MLLHIANLLLTCTNQHVKIGLANDGALSYYPVFYIWSCSKPTVLQCLCVEIFVVMLKMCSCLEIFIIGVKSGLSIFCMDQLDL